MMLSQFISLSIGLFKFTDIRKIIIIVEIDGYTKFVYA